MGRNKAFTLIELMVVIGIIGLLTTIAVISYNKAKIQSRDSRRKIDVETLATAFSMYKAETKTYRLEGLAGIDSAKTGISMINVGATTSIAKYLKDYGYLSSSIRDPKCDGNAVASCEIDGVVWDFYYSTQSSDSIDTPYNKDNPYCPVGVASVFAHLEQAPTAQDNAEFDLSCHTKNPTNALGQPGIFGLNYVKNLN
jgi:prepilin-type N-terminal cleavage/methylation domain-containing protein